MRIANWSQPAKLGSGYGFFGLPPPLAGADLAGACCFCGFGFGCTLCCCRGCACGRCCGCDRGRSAGRLTRSPCGCTGRAARSACGAGRAGRSCRCAGRSLWTGRAERSACGATGRPRSACGRWSLPALRSLRLLPGRSLRAAGRGMSRAGGPRRSVAALPPRSGRSVLNVSAGCPSAACGAPRPCLSSRTLNF